MIIYANQARLRIIKAVLLHKGIKAVHIIINGFYCNVIYAVFKRQLNFIHTVISVRAPCGAEIKKLPVQIHLIKARSRNF